MNIPKFTIGSGFIHAPDNPEWAQWFSRLWIRNIERYTNPKPEKIIVVSNGGCTLPFTYPLVDEINLDGNLGHIHQLIGKQLPAKNHALCGWSGTVLTTALAAYCNETDFIYVEQDCLAFGPWVERLYSELGDRKMLFGKSNCMPAAQSLFIIKHDWIPAFVRAYVLGDERHLGNLPETKFRNMMAMNPTRIGQFSFGFDRDKPIDMTQPVWYSQKNTKAELLEMRERGLVKFDDIPDVKVFTNDTEGLN